MDSNKHWDELNECDKIFRLKKNAYELSNIAYKAAATLSEEQHSTVPVLMWCLEYQEKWDRIEIEECFKELIGIDCFDLPLWEWVERLKERGVEFEDGIPVYVYLETLILSYSYGIKLESMKFNKACKECVCKDHWDED